MEGTVSFSHQLRPENTINRDAGSEVTSNICDGEGERSERMRRRYIEFEGERGREGGEKFEFDGKMP